MLGIVGVIGLGAVVASKAAIVGSDYVGAVVAIDGAGVGIGGGLVRTRAAMDLAASVAIVCARGWFLSVAQKINENKRTLSLSRSRYPSLPSFLPFSSSSLPPCAMTFHCQRAAKLPSTKSIQI